MAGRPLEQLLERCLQEAARTGDTEAVLRRYPQQADQLRPLLEVALATGDYYADVPVPPGGLAAGRTRLLGAATQQRARMQRIEISTRKEQKPKMKLLLATKLASAIMAVVVGTAAVGGGVTFAAGDSLPGDVLYPVKLTGEDLRLSFASTPESQVELALDFADERVAEIEALVERELPVPQTAVARLERHIVRAMNQAAWASEEEMPGLLQRIAQRTQTQAQTLAQLQGGAGDQNQAQVRNAHQICQQAQGDAMAGLDDPQTFRARYQHRNNMPADVTPPEPPIPDPQNGEPGAGPGPAGEPGEPKQNQHQMGTPQGNRDQDCDGDCDQDRDQDQDRDRDQDRDQDQCGQDCDPDRDRAQDRDGDQQQDRDRDQTQDGDGKDDPQQNQDRDGQQNGDGDQTQDRDQQQKQEPNQDRDQQQDQQPDAGNDQPSGNTHGRGS